jgi:hypothetical protein
MRWLYERAAKLAWRVFYDSDYVDEKLLDAYRKGNNAGYDQGASDTLRAMAPDYRPRNKAVTL